jgi:hypothetical protein
LRRQPSLRSQLNQIRLWVRQGRTDAWIAHKLDVSIEQLERFKRDHDLDSDGAAPGRPADPLSVPPPEAGLYEDDDESEEEEPLGALVEEPEEEAPAEPRPRDRGRDRGRAPSQRSERGPSQRSERGQAQPEQAQRGQSQRGQSQRAPSEGAGDGEASAASRRRRRGRRGGRGRRRPSSYEATFDHGEEGYGLWLDPAVVDNPVYAQHWAGQRAVQVTFDRDAITIRRANMDPAAEEAESPDGDEDE